MIFNIQLTLNCNLKCSYCQATSEYSPFPAKSNYPIHLLKTFIEKDPNAVIAFYGGEPLLELDLMFKIMDNIKVKQFILQTNGLLLQKIPLSYLRRFHTIIISIDGREPITDLHRGRGTHKKVLASAKWLREQNYKGELIARMTVTEQTNLYPEVLWLLQLKNPWFDSIHWQLDMMFNDRQLWKDLEGWIKHQYNPQITALITDWVTEMKTNGRVWRIYPFLGVLDRLLFKRSKKLHCGAGWIWQNICTDGTIAACPVGADFRPFHIGHIKDTHPLDTFDALQIGSPCLTCEIYSICGGRCLYANMFKPWGNEGYKLTCETVFHLVEQVSNGKGEIEELLQAKKLAPADFSYELYNCCEIIP